MSEPRDEITHFDHLLAERLLQWQEHQYKDESKEEGPYSSTKAPRWRTAEERKYLIYQDAIDFLITEGINNSVAEENSIGYIALVDPFREEYRIVALIGKWTREQERIWLYEWMKLGTRRISEGKLLRHVYEQEFGEPLFVDWSDPEYISDITQRLNFRYAAVAPLVFGTHFIGMLLFSYPSGQQDKNKLTKLTRLAQIAMVPIVLPSARSMEESTLIKAVSSFYNPSIERIEGKIIKRKHELKEIVSSDATRDSLPEPVKKRLSNIVSGLEQLEISASALRNAFNPTATPAAGKVTSPQVKNIVGAIVSGIITEYEGEYTQFNPRWVRYHLDPSIEIPIPTHSLKAILFEILLNSIKAVVDLFGSIRNSIGEREDSLEVYDAALRQYKRERGAPPRIRVGTKRTESQGNKYIELRVGNNGIGMTRYVRDRAMELGFSTRVAGTGLGLTIVRVHTEAFGGRVILTTSEKTRTDCVTLTLQLPDEN